MLYVLDDNIHTTMKNTGALLFAEKKILLDVNNNNKSTHIFLSQLHSADRHTISGLISTCGEVRIVGNQLDRSKFYAEKLTPYEFRDAGYCSVQNRLLFRCLLT